MSASAAIVDSPRLHVKRRSLIVSETSKTCATGVTREDEISDPSCFSRKSRESRTNNKIRFTRNALLRDFATNRHE
jgi:hypothetical protein